ncbi:MAG: NAD(P)/FAD-dependent oxidoreductase [Acidimicrobiia bacterium]
MPEPRTDRPLRFAIVGAGMSGILAGIKLQEAGLTNFTIFEKADRLGGTWRENTYPGIACDVPSHLYSYSFALNPDWTRHYSPGDEIQAYFERVACEFGVDRNIRFGDEVVACAWNGEGWRIETASGHREDADVVIAATGVLHHPRYPDLAGLDAFRGAMFHSARWDHSVELDGARVGIIGTGSSAVQIVTAIVERVGRLTVFQRTAQWVTPLTNTPFTDEERGRFRDDRTEMLRVRRELEALFDGFADGLVDLESDMMHGIEQVTLANLEEHVTDPVLRELLRPHYRAACKRLVMGENFYEAMQHPNTELVTEAISGIEAGGVRTEDGRLHELDVLVMATGFDVQAFMRPMDITGRDGIRLAETWADRPNAYLSMSIPEFPNFFMLNGPNGPVGNFSLIEVAELQFAYIMELVQKLRVGECREISATHAAMERHEAARTEATKSTIWSTGCRSWYLDDRGVPAVWPWTFTRFREVMAAPDLDAYDLR